MYRAFFGALSRKHGSRILFQCFRVSVRSSEEGLDMLAENDLGIAPSQFEQNESGSEFDPKLVCSLFCPDEDVCVIEIKTVGATILPHVLLHDIDEVVVRQNFGGLAVALPLWRSRLALVRSHAVAK